MSLSRIFKIFEESKTLDSNVSVSAGTTGYSSVLDLGEYANLVSIGYHIDSGGSASVTLEYSFGTDVNGNDVWVQDGSAKTTTSGAFYFDKPASKVRLAIKETGGITALTGVNVFSITRAL